MLVASSFLLSKIVRTSAPHCSAIHSGNHARTSSPAPVTAFCDPLLKCWTCPASRCRRGNYFHTPERHSCREALSLVEGDPLLNGVIVQLARHRTDFILMLTDQQIIFGRVSRSYVFHYLSLTKLWVPHPLRPAKWHIQPGLIVDTKGGQNKAF